MTKSPITFIASDISILDHTPMNYERYSYTWDRGCFIEYLEENNRLTDSDDIHLLQAELVQKYPQAYQEWQSNTDENYLIPLMNALYYYPDLVSFSEADQYKTSSATTLLYDTELERWAVGMTGGGMDLSPHLLDTFISLGMGVPTNIAKNVTRGYNAYIDPEIHQANCDSLGKAMLQEANRWKNYANSLDRD